MNILFIHEVDWLDKVVFDIHTLAEGLSLRGHRIYAIDYPDKWKRKHAFDLAQFKMRESIGVSRAFPGSSVDVFHPGFIKIAGLSRLSAFFTHCCAIRKIIKEKAIDAIVLYSVPTNGLQAACLARQFKIPLVFRSIDILNQLVRYPALRRLTRFLERQVYSRSDKLLTLTPSLTKYVADLGAAESKVELLLMPVDISLFHPLDDVSEMRRKWNISENDKVVLFIGTLFDFSGLDAFLRQFPDVMKRIPEARLLIVGDGPQRSKLEGIITETNLRERVTITGFQPYNTMPQYINLSAVCMNSFLLTGATRDIFPGKIVQYLACGKPVLATPLAGMKAVIPGEDQGVVYSDGIDDLGEKTVSLLQSAERRERLGRQGLAYVKQRHTYDTIAQQLEAALQKLTSKK